MPPELNPDAGPPDQWQTIEQWLDTPQFRQMMKDEFPEDAAEWLDPATRRQFLTLMGASAALAGAVGCNPSLRPASERVAIPYVEQPTEITPSVPLFFATAMPQAGGVGLGVLARSYMGRPNKVEGNPSHPSSVGHTNILAQGHLLGLYDPDRSKEVVQTGAPASYQRFQSAVRAELEKQVPKRGAGIRLLTPPTTSPTLAAQFEAFLARFPDAKWVQWEAAAGNRAAAAKAAFGRVVQPVYRMDRVNVALSLDADFLAASTPADVRYTNDFMKRRHVRKLEAAQEAGDGVKPEEMNRLYAVESMLTCTGAVADHRLPVQPSQVEAFARALAAELGVAGVAAGGELPELARKWVKPLADDLRDAKNRGKAVVVAGEHQPAAVQQIAFAVNQALGAVGETVVYIDPLQPRAGDEYGLKQLVADMKAGAVQVLFVLDGNPVFDAPADYDIVPAFSKVPTRIHLGTHYDETAAQCNWHLPLAHYLETWGDVRGHDGTLTLQQPLIAPLFGGRSTLELVSYLAGLAAELVPGEGQKPAATAGADPMELVRATARRVFDDKVKTGDFDTWWQQAVRAGLVKESAFAPVGGLTASAAGLDQPPAAPAAKAGGLEVQFLPDPTLFDGRYANNGWLQELPKPVFKIAWDNAAIVSPATAEKLGVSIRFPQTAGEHGRSEADLVELTVNGRKLKVAAFILPGHADDAITLHFGHGRTRAGKVGTGTGFNAYELRTSAAPWLAAGAEVRKLNDTYFLGCTQGQYAMEGRRPARSATVEQFKADPVFAQIPPASAAEYKEIRALTPGTVEDFDRLGIEHPYAHDHGLPAGGHGHHDHDHDHGKGEKKSADQAAHPEKKYDHGHGPHDPRIIPLSLYPDYPQKVNGEQAVKSYRRWGMVIDLGACTGCTACVVACQAENNIPVVGKTEVTRGRAMHWLRIDRYFSIPGAKTMEDDLGDRDERSRRAERVKESARIDTHFQPLMCVHCEKAPCEVVCPVAATVHSADGLNDMVYNRCVGTRYCANNCPYKVRRFNFLQYADYATPSLKLVNNTEVTVRTRGVMEKCTYCVQRIRNAEIEAEREWSVRPKDPRTGRPKIKDGEVITACQAACPADAIVFGDINDLGSKVLRAKAEPHAYGLLAEINTMPRTSYIAAIRNPNPAIETLLPPVGAGTTKGGA